MTADHDPAAPDLMGEPAEVLTVTARDVEWTVLLDDDGRTVRGIAARDAELIELLKPGVVLAVQEATDRAVRTQLQRDADDAAASAIEARRAA